MERFESDYYAHRAFDGEHLRRIRSHYVPFFAGASGPVLELGCGQGEFLELLRDAGIAGVGVDLDDGMVARATAKGLDARLGDALSFVAGDPPPGGFGGVFCAHLLEHLQPSDAAALLRGAAAVAGPGAAIVVVVPNPACLAVLSHDFWADPTHVRFYDPALIEFLCVEAGLVVVEQGANPLDHPGPPPGYEADLVLDDRAPWSDEGGVDPAVAELRRQLRQTQAALRDLERAHRTLVRGLYEPNEVYVVARTSPGR